MANIEATARAWQLLAQIQRGERAAGVDGLRLLAESAEGRAVILANPAVMEPLVRALPQPCHKTLQHLVLLPAASLSTAPTRVDSDHSLSRAIFSLIAQGARTLIDSRTAQVNILRLAGALPGEDGVAVSTAAAAFYRLSTAPGAPEQLAQLAVDMLIPSLLRLSATGSEPGKQQVRNSSARPLGGSPEVGLALYPQQPARVRC